MKGKMRFREGLTPAVPGDSEMEPHTCPVKLWAGC